jgi:hypothetical protein
MWHFVENCPAANDLAQRCTMYTGADDQALRLNGILWAGDGKRPGSADYRFAMNSQRKCVESHSYRYHWQYHFLSRDSSLHPALRQCSSCDLPAISCLCQGRRSPGLLLFCRRGQI